MYFNSVATPKTVDIYYTIELGINKLHKIRSKYIYGYKYGQINNKSFSRAHSALTLHFFLLVICLSKLMEQN